MTDPHIPAKPIVPGCKVMVIKGPDTGFLTTAVKRVFAHGTQYNGIKSSRKYWGWLTDPRPLRGSHGYEEKLLMRIDDDDELKQLEDKRERDRERGTGNLAGSHIGA